MKGILIILEKELKDYFTTSLFYIILTAFSFVIGYFFFNYLINVKEFTTVTVLTNVVTPLFGNINLLVLILSPLLTMKIFSQESRDGTLDLLLGSNLKYYEIILGKFLSIMTIIFVLLTYCSFVPITLHFIGYDNPYLFFTSFVGLFFCASFYISIGILASSITSNQILSSFLSYGGILFFIFLIQPARATSNYIVKSALQYLSVSYHYDYFAKGAVASYSLIYFVSMIFIFLFITSIVLSKRKW